MKQMKKKSDLKPVKKLTVNKTSTVNQSDEDKRILDLVLKRLYSNSHKDILHLENDIYKPLKVNLSHPELERLWSVMTSTGLISPVIGFGNAGKVELTRSGYQLMSQYGGYQEYISAMNNQQPQTVILPIQLESDFSQGDETPTVEKAQKKRAQKK